MKIHKKEIRIYMNSMKGNVTVVVALIIVVAALGIMIERVAGEYIWSTKESMNVYNKHYTLAMDKIIQSMKQGFLKTAAFFSLNTVSKELAEHGGYTRAALMDNNPPNGIADITESKEPRILVKKDPDTQENIPFWIAPDMSNPGAGSCVNTLKRVPYLKDTDENLAAGDRFIRIIWNDADHAQYINEVNAGKYPLYVSIQLFMLWPGTVEITCKASEGCIQMNPTGNTPAVITTDGIYTYKITKIDPSKVITALHITARNRLGEIDKVVRVKQVSVSIHDPVIDPSKATTPNARLTEELGNYYWDMNAELEKRNTEQEIKMTMAPLIGTMTRGNYKMYVEGMVWPDESGGGIRTLVDDIFFPGNKLAEIRDSGLIKEETKLRYYLLYDYAEKFTDISEALFKYRLWNRLNNDFQDTSNPSQSFCDRSPCKPGCDKCADDTVQTYQKSDFENAIDIELFDIENELNAQTNEDSMTWTVMLKDFDMQDKDAPMVTDCKANRANGPCSVVEECNSRNFEHYEYRKGKFESGGCCQCEETKDTSCSHSSVNAGPGHPPHCTGARTTTCYMKYRHRYVLKNLKIEVTLTDNDYKYYDTTSNSWENLVFKFYLTVPFVDDNCCDGKQCDDIKFNAVEQDCIDIPPAVAIDL